VHNVVKELTSELEIDKVIPKVIQIAQRLVGGDGGLVALWDEEKSVITYPYLHNLPLKLSTVTVSRGGGLSGEVMTTGRPTVIENYPDYPNAVPEFVAAGVTSAAAVPIVSGDRIFGALAVVSLGQTKNLLDRDLLVLSSIGRQAGIAVENAYLYGNLRFYARRITYAQEEERKRIARELHDDTIQSLIALSRRLEALSTSGEQLSEAVSHHIRDLWEQTDDMIQRVRRFSKNLRPSILDDLGLVPTLEELTADLNREADLRADFEVVGERRRLSSELELTLFRVAQEALTNVRKHAQATHVLTRIEISDGLVRMVVQDNGIGFKPPAFNESRTTESELGLIGMHERVRLLGGALVIESAPRHGTNVIVNVPV
jgi:signal transduction histidine kinase